jgi:protein-S-isoprenylcysteine O-methyltransferase Ste14
MGALVLVLARPSQATVAAGMTLAACGEAIRFWAAGHLQKSREVTVSGPYRWTAHPLYLGSTIMGIGLAIACGSVVVALLIGVYLATTVTAASIPATSRVIGISNAEPALNTSVRA